MQAEANQLRDRLLSAVEVDPETRRVSGELYRQLAAGRSVRLDDVAASLAVPSTRVKEALERATLSAIEYDEDRRVVAFGGLSLKPTSHRFQVGEQTLYTWCAFDTLFLPQVLKKRAQVESTCPVSGRQVHLTVTPNGIDNCSPQAAFVSLVTPDASQLKGKLKATFCCHVHFFASEDAASTWLSKHENAVVLPVVEAFELAQAFARALV